MDAEWRSEDAWLLLARLYIEGNAPESLDKVVAVMDFINHAIPTPRQLHGAINRLWSAGLLRVRNDRLAATAKARTLFEKVVAGCQRNVPSQLKGLRRILDCPCCGVRLKLVRSKPLDEQIYLKAIDDYLGAPKFSAKRAATRKEGSAKKLPARRRSS